MQNNWADTSAQEIQHKIYKKVSSIKSATQNVPQNFAAQKCAVNKSQHTIILMKNHLSFGQPYFGCMDKVRRYHHREKLRSPTLHGRNFKPIIQLKKNPEFLSQF